MIDIGYIHEGRAAEFIHAETVANAATLPPALVASLAFDLSSTEATSPAAGVGRVVPRPASSTH